MATGFVQNIEELTRKNTSFRRVLYTAKNTQLVLMTIKPSEEIGEEVHDHNDQFFRVEEGIGKAVIDGNEYQVSNGSAIIIPAGSKHNVTNLSDKDLLKMYTLYSPPHHKDGTVHETKEIAKTSSEEFDGILSE